MKGHIRKRGLKSWAIKVELPRDPVTGKRRTKWHTVRGTKRQAEIELTRLLHEINTGQYAEPSRMSVAQYLEHWLETYAQHNVSGKTFERYEQIVRSHLVPGLGSLKLAHLAPMHVQEYLANGLANGRVDGKGGLSPQSVKHHYRVLSQALRQAVRWQVLARNPCASVDPPRVPRREMAILDHQQAAQLLKSAEPRPEYVAVLLALTTGMRRGEILALRWSDVDLNGRTLAVRQTLEQTRAGLNFKQPKTPRSRRAISLASIAVQALHRHRIAQATERLRLGPAYIDNDLVNARPGGSPMNPHGLTYAFSELAKRNGLSVRFHDLRHTHISHLLAAGVHPKIASERAGHASVSITMDVYSHLMPGLQQEAAERVDAALRLALEE
ncbi:MAG: site-specific integrase [Rhodospirillales bacterium]|nr:site-specific integrase [Rhodospirillales bacterium]